MLQEANKIDLFNPLVPKSHNNECQNLLFPLQIKSAKASLRIFTFFTLRTNGLNAKRSLLAKLPIAIFEIPFYIFYYSFKLVTVRLFKAPRKLTFRFPQLVLYR